MGKIILGFSVSLDGFINDRKTPSKVSSLTVEVRKS
jgi:hypothetical protein